MATDKSQDEKNHAVLKTVLEALSELDGDTQARILMTAAVFLDIAIEAPLESDKFRLERIRR